MKPLARSLGRTVLLLRFVHCLWMTDGRLRWLQAWLSVAICCLAVRHRGPARAVLGLIRACCEQSKDPSFTVSPPWSLCWGDLVPASRRLMSSSVFWSSRVFWCLAFANWEMIGVPGSGLSDYSAWIEIVTRWIFDWSHSVPKLLVERSTFVEMLVHSGATMGGSLLYSANSHEFT